MDPPVHPTAPARGCRPAATSLACQRVAAPRRRPCDPNFAKHSPVTRLHAGRAAPGNRERSAGRVSARGQCPRGPALRGGPWYRRCNQTSAGSPYQMLGACSCGAELLKVWSGAAHNAMAQIRHSLRRDARAVHAPKARLVKVFADQRLHQQVHLSHGACDNSMPCHAWLKGRNVVERRVWNAVRGIACKGQYASECMCSLTGALVLGCVFNRGWDISAYCIATWPEKFGQSTLIPSCPSSDGPGLSSCPSSRHPGRRTPPARAPPCPSWPCCAAG